MRKKLKIGLTVFFLSSSVFANSVFAEFGGGSNPPVVPEPVSCLLFLASGATYAGIRYLRARRNSKKFSKHLYENNNEGV